MRERLITSSMLLTATAFALADAAPHAAAQDTAMRTARTPDVWSAA
jgi:hypothetical protein